VSIRVVIKCDSDWFGFPCRGAITVPSDQAPTVTFAEKHGWTMPLGKTTALCPAHTLAAKTLAAAR